MTPEEILAQAKTTNIPKSEPEVTSEAAQEKHEDALASFNTKKLDDMRVSLNGLPLTAEQKKQFGIEDE
jgi:hypothetical protein